MQKEEQKPFHVSSLKGAQSQYYEFCQCAKLHLN